MLIMQMKPFYRVTKGYTKAIEYSLDTFLFARRLRRRTPQFCLKIEKFI